MRSKKKGIKQDRDITMSSQKHLVLQHLENISGKILQDYAAIVKDFIKGKAGVYALYNKDKLYYIGLASNLMNRLRIHLNDRHTGLWDRFSVYLTVHDEHMKELESLLLKIYKTKGNKTGGSFMQSVNLKPSLNKEIKEFYDRELAALLGSSTILKNRIKKVKLSKGSKGLPGTLDKRIIIKASYKKKEYQASLRKDGKISFDGKLYNSPSSAATAVSGTSIDGWYFWKFKDEKGEWVKLDELRER